MGRLVPAYLLMSEFDRSQLHRAIAIVMITWRWKARWATLAALLLAVSCSDNSSPTADDPPAASSIAQTTSSTETTVTALTDGTGTSTSDDLAVLPVRDGPRRETTRSVPHIQIDAEPVPNVDAELRRRAFSLPGVENRESELSLPGARSLSLTDAIELARPEVLQAEGEFAHIHPNGSLHVWLPVERATEVAETKWGELHPWVDREDFWDGLVMIYTPETLDELDVTMQLIVDAYNYVTGANLDPASFK